MIKLKAYGFSEPVYRTIFDRNWYTVDDLCFCSARPEDRNRLKVVQFTGLKDKDGIEIYEGDIVKLYDCQDGTRDGKPLPAYIHTKVIWDENSHRWSVTRNNFNMDFSGHWWCFKKEVIGNIYENPELLEKAE